VRISCAIQSPRRWRRTAPTAISTALLSALLLAVPANAETSGVPGDPVSPPATEVTNVVEQVAGPAPVEQPVEQVEAAGVASAASEQVEATGGASEQVETPAVASAANEAEVPTEPSKAVTEVEDVSSGSSSPATQVRHIASSVPSLDKTTDPPSVDVPVDVPSGDGPATMEPKAVVGRVVEETRRAPAPERHVAALVDGAHQRSNETIAGATESFGPPRGGVTLPPGLPAPAISDVAEETQPSAATRVATETTGDRPTPFLNPQRRSDLLSSPRAIEPRLKLGEYATDAGPATDDVQDPALHHWGIGLSPGTEAVETAVTSPGDRHLGNSAPPDLPPLAPPSPAIAVGDDAGGPSSVPVVALLALLALAAPTARRRLGEVAAFRPPTPFICALERPG
jgi:MYXO-CTERM domain-containing protein